MPGSTVLVNTSIPPERFFDTLPFELQRQLVEKQCRLFVIDGYGVAGRRVEPSINTVMRCVSSSCRVPRWTKRCVTFARASATFGRRGPECAAQYHASSPR
jgi:hypothetical protein